ncbi:MAG: 2-oxo acid dehydrogenase subunit E2 [Micavibrio sp.]
MVDVFTNDYIAKLPRSQIDLIHQMQRSEGVVIQANIEMPVDWEVIDNLRILFRAKKNSVVPSSIELIFWSVSQAMFSFPKFRSKLREDLSLEMTKDACIGKAVAGKEDTILTPVLAVTKGEDVQTLVSNLRNMAQSEYNEKGFSYHSLVVSDMSALGVMRANPVVIYPAIATLFVGKPYFVMTESRKRKMSNFVLAFDHRAINGAYAAKFIKEIENNLIRLRRANIANRIL